MNSNLETYQALFGGFEHVYLVVESGRCKNAAGSSWRQSNKLKKVHNLQIKQHVHLFLFLLFENSIITLTIIIVLIL